MSVKIIKVNNDRRYNYFPLFDVIFVLSKTELYSMLNA